jgi:hypothetical protein
MSKLKIGIEINEILRARWLQFDRFYDQEFGTEDMTSTYVYDFFRDYAWKDKIEIEKELKEPGDMPENINPIEYQVDEKLGDAPADAFLFKGAKEIHLTAKEVFNRFLYEDFVFEIHGSTPMMYKGMDLHVNEFYQKYKDTVEFVLFSKENQLSIPSTLFFLSKTRCRFSNYRFVETNDEMWEGLDILVTTDPELLDNVPEGKNVIKLNRPYNGQSQDGLIKSLLQIHDLDGNPEFEKLINYVAPPEVEDTSVKVEYNNPKIKLL